jgi:hypothetical protein
MGKKWTVNANDPARTEKYEWRVPNNENQHVEQSTSPKDLRLKPKDISLVPTLAPKRSGIQHGHVDWNYVSDPSGGSAWYIAGAIVQEDN